MLTISNPTELDYTSKYLTILLTGKLNTANILNETS